MSESTVETAAVDSETSRSGGGAVAGTTNDSFGFRVSGYRVKGLGFRGIGFRGIGFKV